MTTVVRVGLVALLAAVAARAAGNCTDGVLNNNETQVDCGGPSCPACAAASTMPTPSPSPRSEQVTVGQASALFQDTGFLAGAGVGSVIISLVFHIVLLRCTAEAKSRSVSLVGRGNNHGKQSGGRGSRRRASVTELQSNRRGHAGSSSTMSSKTGFASRHNQSGMSAAATPSHMHRLQVTDE